MNLTDRERQQLQQRLAKARHELVVLGLTPTPVPAHPLADHEASAFVEWEEHRSRIEADEIAIHYRARPVTRTINPQVMADVVAESTVRTPAKSPRTNTRSPQARKRTITKAARHRTKGHAA